MLGNLTNCSIEKQVRCLSLSQPASPIPGGLGTLLTKEAIKKQVSPNEGDGGGYRKSTRVKTEVNEVKWLSGRQLTL